MSSVSLPVGVRKKNHVPDPTETLRYKMLKIFMEDLNLTDSMTRTCCRLGVPKATGYRYVREFHNYQEVKK